jgi:hypothetical protein
LMFWKTTFSTQPWPVKFWASPTQNGQFSLILRMPTRGDDGRSLFSLPSGERTATCESSRAKRRETEEKNRHRPTDPMLQPWPVNVMFRVKTHPKRVGFRSFFGGCYKCHTPSGRW